MPRPERMASARIRQRGRDIAEANRIFDGFVGDFAADTIDQFDFRVDGRRIFGTLGFGAELGGPGLGLAPEASRGRLSFEADLEAAVRGADLVQENGPERIDFKRELYARLDRLLPASTLIASSSSGLTMSEIQKACADHPERCLIGHPFNPPHLIPLVELVGGAQTSEETLQRAAAFYEGHGFVRLADSLRLVLPMRAIQQMIES